MKNSFGFFTSLFLITTFSLSTVWSTSPSLAPNQITFVLIAIFFALVIGKRSPNLIKTFSFPAYVTAITLLLLTFVLGRVTRGTVRWIEIGPFNLQTSEVAKPFLILSFAHFFSQPIHRPMRWLIERILLFLPIAALVFLQPDLGSTIVISLIWFGMLIFSPLPSKFPIGLVLVGIVLLPLGLRLLQPYQLERFTAFLNPYADPSGSGYNVIQSQIAIGSGRLFGKGVRQGTQSHLRFLPEKHTDFAYASFAEEFGFLGSLVLIASFSYILFWLTGKAKQSDTFNNLVVIGVFWYFFSQIIINLGMNLSLMPVTGITLPLFSYGGSSLLSFGIAVGMVLAFSKRTG